MSDSGDQTRLRVDKWLWAARFYKTRALAAAAVEGGKAQVNGERVKPAKLLKAGDALVVRNGPFEWDITVLALSERRGPAAEAAKLYREAEESRKTREEKAALIKAERASNPVYLKGRPTKKARRQIIRFTREQD
ncbi:MAG TPA: S4 domain-containing protein [Burkholderiales bacterium]|nr:S4 domain-containing protein [Burkholderiales bacterium]